MLIILTNKNRFASLGVNDSAKTASTAKRSLTLFGVNNLITKDLTC